ncbi:MAG: hypothetical protein JWP77_2021 [Polaromonas sp.]|nr:hypothetical protein [Polaromonas sp.]
MTPSQDQDDLGGKFALQSGKLLRPDTLPGPDVQA